MNHRLGLPGMAIVASLTAAPTQAEPADLALRYDRPATNWQSEALPLGNGRLGCMVFGGVPRERLQFNEDSLWIGDESETGAYQAFGDVFIAFDHAAYEGYSRRLDLADAVYSQAYKSGGVRYARQYFASAPAQVLVFRFTADKPGAYSGRIERTDTHGATITAQGARLTSSGDLRGFFYPESKRRGPEEPQYRVARQGQRPLSRLQGKYLGEEVDVPAGDSLLALEAMLGRMLLEQANC